MEREKENKPYDKWHQRQMRMLGLHLLNAVKTLNHVVGHKPLRNLLIEKIAELDLPNESCKRCGANTDFFTWGIQSGYCINCIKELNSK